MFLSKVEPFKAEDYHKRRADGNSSSAAHTDIGSTDCDFRNSAIYDVMRYPLILLNICCINVPAPCVCGINFYKALRQPREHNERNGEYISDANNVNIIHKSRILGRRQCLNSDNRLWSLTKTVLFIIVLIYQIADTVISCYIVKMGFDRKNESHVKILSLVGLFAALFLLYLRISNWHSCCKHLRSFFYTAFMYEKQFGFTFNQKTLKRRGKTASCLLLLYHALQSSFYLLSVYVFVTDEELVKIEAWPYMNLEENVMYYVCTAVAVFSFFSTSIVSGVFVFKTITICVLSGEFESLRDELITDMVEIENYSSSEEKFDVFMKKLRALNNLMDKSYQVVKHTVAAAYMFGFPKICLVLFVLLSSSVRLDQTVLMAWSIAEPLVLMLFTTMLLARLQTKARSVVDVVYAADCSKFSQQLFQKVTFLTTMFTNKSFGVSVYGLFVVDWSTLLMVGGTLLTYSLVVVQFQGAEQTAPEHDVRVNI